MLFEWIHAVIPWEAFALSLMMFYMSARLYLKTRLISAYLCGYLAGALGWAGMGVSRLLGSHPGWLRDGCDFVSVSSFAVAAAFFVYCLYRLEPKRPA